MPLRYRQGTGRRGRRVRSTTVTIPAGTIPGGYYVVVRADADGAVAESLETNNTIARAIQVGPGS
jgi:trimeric autotransporter adhesin